MTNPPERILLIKISSMGDILHALPALNALRDRFPAAHITWLVDERFADLLRGHRALDEVLLARAPRWVNRIRIRQDVARGAAHFRVISELRRHSFDLAVDMQGLFRSAVLARASRARHTIGFANAREGAPLLYSQRIQHSDHPHVVRHYLDLAEAITGVTPQIRFDLPIRTEANQAVDLWLAKHQIVPGNPFVIIAPKSSRPEKDWSPKQFADVARHLGRLSFPVVIIGGGSERSACEQVARLADDKPHLFTGQPLTWVAALIARARLLIGPDSGPVHLSAAVQTPTIALFGPTPPARLAPWGFEHLVVSNSSNCRACQRRQRSGHTCLSQLSSGVVIDRVEQVLSRAREAA